MRFLADKLRHFITIKASKELIGKWCLKFFKDKGQIVRLDKLFGFLYNQMVSQILCCYQTTPHPQMQNPGGPV